MVEFSKLERGAYYLDGSKKLYQKIKNVKSESNSYNTYNCINPQTGCLFYEDSKELVIPVTDITIKY